MHKISSFENRQPYLQQFVHFTFVHKLRMTSNNWFQLHCNLFARCDVNSKVNISKGTRANLSQEPPFSGYNEFTSIRLGGLPAFSVIHSKIKIPSFERHQKLIKTQETQRSLSDRGVQLQQAFDSQTNFHYG